MLLISCSSQDEEAENRGLDQVSKDWIILSVPSSWQEISPASLPIPNAGEVVFASESTQERGGYFNNLVVLKEENDNSSSSESLVKENISFLKQNMRSFSLLEEKNISFTDGWTGIILLFSGKYNVQTPEVIYLQTARSCPNWDFLLTLSIWEKQESYEQYEYILQTLSCS